MTAIPTSMPWYRSTVIIGAIVSILAKVLVMTGLIGELAPDDEAELTNLIVLLIGGIGDIVAIGSRVRQKHAPAITGATTTYVANGRHYSWLALLLLPLFLVASCGWTPPAGNLPVPSDQADRTTLDEQTALSVELAYQAANKAATLGITSGLIRDNATIRRIGEADRQAYAAVQAVRAAYLAGNAADYLTASQQARAAVGAILSALNGG